MLVSSLLFLVLQLKPSQSSLRSSLQLDSRISEYSTLLDAFKLLEANQVSLQKTNSTLLTECDGNKSLRMDLTVKTEELEALKIRCGELERERKRVKVEADIKVKEVTSQMSTKDRVLHEEVKKLKDGLERQERELESTKKQADDTVAELTEKLVESKRILGETEKEREREVRGDMERSDGWKVFSCRETDSIHCRCEAI